jgi:hypothetical protein
VKNQGKEIALQVQVIEIKLLFQAVVGETTEQRGVSRQVRVRRGGRGERAILAGQGVSLMWFSATCWFVFWYHQSHPGCFSLSESSIRGVMGLEVRFLAVLREEFP